MLTLPLENAGGEIVDQGEKAPLIQRLVHSLINSATFSVEPAAIALWPINAPS